MVTTVAYLPCISVGVIHTGIVALVNPLQEKVNNLLSPNKHIQLMLTIKYDHS